MDNLEFARDVVRAISGLEDVSIQLCDWCAEADKTRNNDLTANQSEDEYWYHELSQGHIMDCDASHVRSVISDLETAVIIAGYSFLFDNIWATSASDASTKQGES